MPPKQQRLIIDANTTMTSNNPPTSSPTQVKHNQSSINTGNQVVQLPPTQQPTSNSKSTTTIRSITNTKAEAVPSIPRKRTFGTTGLGEIADHAEESIKGEISKSSQLGSKNTSNKGNDKRPQLETVPRDDDPRSGFTFDLMRIHHDLIATCSASLPIRIDPSASIYTTGVLQYLTREVVNLCIAVLSFEQANKLKELRAEMHNRANGGVNNEEEDEDDGDNSYDETEDGEGEQEEDEKEEDYDHDDDQIDPSQIDPLVRKEVAKLFLSKFGIKMDSQSESGDDSDRVDHDADGEADEGDKVDKPSSTLPELSFSHPNPKQSLTSDHKEFKSPQSLPMIDLAMMSDLVLPQMTITPELLRFLFENDQELADVYTIRDDSGGDESEELDTVN